MSQNLNSQKALIFRITHRENFLWISQNGLHCATSKIRDPNFRTIGNVELIDRRSRRHVNHPMGGTLSDYVPFYFTPFSPMLLNIITGYNGVPKQAKRDIVILVSSLHKLVERNVPFLFTDRHAVLATARFSSNLNDLSWIDWPLLQSRNFKRDPNDMGKVERYEAEALARGSVPIEALVGVFCYDDLAGTQISDIVSDGGFGLKVIVNPKLFF